MKKKILMIILCIMFIPFFVNAKDNCTVVSGTGENIGDEIKCGTESFYIVSKTDDTVSMLAKYNLFVGDKIDYFDLDETQTFDDFFDAQDLCYSEAEQRGYNAYYTYPMAVDPNSYPTFDVKGCRVYEEIEYDKVVQDERAVGTTLVNGKSVLPLYGIVYMSPEWEEAKADKEFSFEYDSKGNLKLSTTPFEKYINGYKDELKRQNIDVQDVSFITISRTIELLENVSGKKVEIEFDYPEGGLYGYDQDKYEYFYNFMDIKEYTGEKHKWIYNTTYWLGSGFIGDDTTPNEEMHNDYYISNEGMLCAIGRQGECQYFNYPIGNGIRPLVTIPKNEIKKPIVNPETGNIAALIIILMISFISIGFYTYKNKNIK